MNYGEGSKVAPNFLFQVLKHAHLPAPPTFEGYPRIIFCARSFNNLLCFSPVHSMSLVWYQSLFWSDSVFPFRGTDCPFLSVFAGWITRNDRRWLRITCFKSSNTCTFPLLQHDCWRLLKNYFLRALITFVLSPVHSMSLVWYQSLLWSYSVFPLRGTACP